MKIITLAALLICSSIFMVEASEKKNMTTRVTVTASRKKSLDPQAQLNIKNKKKQTEKRKEARNRIENFKEKGEDYFYFRD